MLHHKRIAHLGPSLYMALGALIAAAAAGIAMWKHAGLDAVVIGMLAGAIAGALLGEALGMLVIKLRQPRQRAQGDGTFAWHVDPPDDLRSSDEWDSDIGQSRIAWAKATLAARDAWERAARQSRKRVALGDPPPRSGEDT
jgi:hypothetical protein